jgi:RHS repeat-associated protein
MKRVFQVSEITTLCNELKTLLNGCKTHISNMKTYAEQADEALAEVPGEVRHYGAVYSVSELRSALKTEKIEDALTKLENCRVRACELIPAADTDYAAQTRELMGVTKNLQTLLEEMEQFLIHTPLTTDYSAFKKAFEEVQARWNKVTENAEKVVEKLMANIKGAETICHAFSKDPVNLSTGNFIYDRTDLEVGGREPFVFRRFYNAINGREGVLGKDWNHNYEVHLEFTDGEAVLLREDGKEERFFWEKDRYLSLFASEGTLEKAEDGYTYRTREQKVYRFDREGMCLETETLLGGRVTFTYETEAPFHLVKAEKDTGEFFAFSYGADGMLERVEDHVGRCLSYQYQGGLLKEVTLPDGNTFRYGYTPQGKLEQVENQRGIVTVENFFDEEHRTTLQKFPDGTRMSYVYDAEKKAVELTERNGSRVIYVHDDKYRDVKHIHSNGEERFAYNQNNQKTLYVDRLGNKTQYAYDPAGNLVRVIDALGNKTEIRYGEKNQPTGIKINGKDKLCGEYDAQGRLVKTRDALGNEVEITYTASGWPQTIQQADKSRISLSYDAKGNITAIEDALGNVTRYAYDALNRMVESTDGKGNVTKYAYDVMGNVTCVENAEGNRQSYEYNASGKVTKVTDFDGASIQREYNVLNRPSKIIDKEGRETLLTYDSMWNLARVTASDGARTTYLYNEENLLSRIKYADGAVVRYTYDANGNRIGEEDENGAKTTFVYDALGRAVEVTGEEGLHYAYRYDGEGNLIEAEDALGNTVSMEYDGNGNLVKETNALGESRHYTYTPLGDVESITDEAGRTTCYQYQKGGLLEKIQYSDGTEEAFTYDANGNLETHTLATGFVLRYGYDSMDRITEITGSEGEKKSYTYDALGNVTSMTDGEGNTTRYAYTLSGQLAKVTDALGNETQYRYDACDRLIEICQYGEKADQEFLEAEERNRRGRRCQVTRYHRDIRGQITEVTDAMGQKETYTYDKKGQLLGKLDKEGYLTKYAYTKQGDLSGIQYADGREVKLSYNPLRQLTEIQDWLGSTKITPDALGRAEKVQYPDGREVSYTYGKAGERRSLTYPDGKTVFYGYDEQFRLSELKEGDSIITYGYDPVGRLCEKQFPNGTKTTYRYDRKDQVTELVHRDKEGILDRYTYLYDLLGNKTGITKERRGLEQESGSYTYGYDALGRLSEIQKDGKVQTQYGYDAFGNRIWKEESRERTSYQYNDLNQMVSERQGEIRKEYGYDKRGNLTSILENGTWKKQYVYGAINRLEEAVDAAGKQARYQYNGLGHRVGKQEGVLPKEKLEKLDPQRRIGMEIGNSRQITYALDLTRQYHNLLERTEESKSQRYFWDGNVAAYEENGERNYYLQDELGSPLRIEDSAGTLLESYGYGAFGEDLYQNQGKIQPFGYTGYQRDEVSGTYYAQAREYLAESGRFAGQDIMTGTVKYPETFNLYKYSFNQPLKYIDPSGETEEEFCENISTAFSRYGEQFIESVSSPQNWGLWALDGSFAALEVYKQITKHIPQFKTNANNKTLVNISDSVNYKGGRGGVRRISKAKLLQQDSSLGEAYRTQMKLDKLSKGLVCLNGAVSFISEYNSNPDLSVKEKIVNSSVEATWSIGSSVAIGSALGSLLPGAGTIVGAIGGFVVGTAASILIDGIAKTKWFDGGTKSVLDYVKQGVNKVVDGIGDAFSGFGEFVFG